MTLVSYSWFRSLALFVLASLAACQFTPTTTAPTAVPTMALRATSLAPQAANPTAPILVPTAHAGALGITIETPAPGTQVGSPVVLTGRTSVPPPNGELRYRVRDAANAEIGGGTLAVQSDGGRGGVYTASLTFTEPGGGGAVSVELYQLDASGALIGSVTMPLVVASPQVILFDTPLPGTQVGSPMVITGHTARFPYQGTLSYRFFDEAGQDRGSGFFPVSGTPGQPASFTASLEFALPPSGGQIQLVVTDEDAVTRVVVASATLPLLVAPPVVVTYSTMAPVITVGTPPVVGSIPTAEVVPTVPTARPACSTLTCRGDGIAQVFPPGGPNDPSFDPCPSPSGQPWIDTTQPRIIQQGQQRFFYACDFATTPVSATVTLPDGSVQAVPLLSALPHPLLRPGRAQAFVSWTALPTDATGVHMLHIGDGSGQVADMPFRVDPPSLVHILVLPPMSPPGGSIQVYLVNVPLGVTATLDLYGEDAPTTSGTYTMSHRRRFEVPITQALASGNGWGQLSLQTVLDDPAVTYALTSNNREAEALFWLR